MKRTPKSFRQWWAGIQSHKRDKRKEITDRWLYYATKTVSMRGNHDEQLVVFTIWNRYSKSKWDIPMYNARIVYDIVNQKQLAFKRNKDSNKTVPVVYKKRTSHRVISSGYNSKVKINYNK